MGATFHLLGNKLCDHLYQSGARINNVSVLAFSTAYATVMPLMRQRATRMRMTVMVVM